MVLDFPTGPHLQLFGSSLAQNGTMTTVVWYEGGKTEEIKCETTQEKDYADGQ